MELKDIVIKLTGPIQPVGETYADTMRLDNLKKVIGVVEDLMYELSLAATFKSSHEHSAKTIGKHAADFLDSLDASGTAEKLVKVEEELRNALRLLNNWSAWEEMGCGTLGALAPETEAALQSEYRSPPKEEGKAPKKCDIRWCKSGLPGFYRSTEVIGDGAFSITICSECFRLFGDTLPEADVVERKVRKRDKDERKAN